MKSRNLKVIFLAFLIQMLKASDEGDTWARYHKEIPRKNEKELKIKIVGGIGYFHILPGSSDKIAIIDGYIRKNVSKSFVNVEYFVDGDIGYLEFEVKKISSGKTPSDEKWYIKICDDIPTTLDIELGASRADIELGGLSLKGLRISTGVSSIGLKFTTPNRITMRRFEIESGVAKFSGEKLGNAKFRNFRFSGGVGSFDIDFTGELIDGADLNFEIGLGNLDIYLPKDVGVTLRTLLSFFSSKKLDGFYRKGDKFISFNYENAQRRINVFIESGLGNIRLRWVE